MAHFQPREFYQRLILLAKNPKEGFAKVAADPVDELWELFPIAAILAAIRPLSAAIATLLYSSNSRLGSFLVKLLLAPLSWGILVVSAGVVAYGVFSIAHRLSSRKDFLASMKVIVWGLAPYWISFIGVLIPVSALQVFFRIAGIAGTTYLWYYGFSILLNTPQKPPTTVGLFALGAGCACGILIFLLDKLFLDFLLEPSLVQLIIGS